ncbi:MAG: hypothetical protein LBK25_03730 [Treponema sp.]|nr:hypothetical protein [Treponema sp.]
MSRCGRCLTSKVSNTGVCRRGVGTRRRAAVSVTAGVAGAGVVSGTGGARRGIRQR